MAMGNSLKITWCETMRSCITQKYTMDGIFFLTLARIPASELGPRSCVPCWPDALHGAMGYMGQIMSGVCS